MDKNDRFTYRIVTEKGLVDFARTYEAAMQKYKRCAADQEMCEICWERWKEEQDG